MNVNRVPGDLFPENEDNVAKDSSLGSLGKDRKFHLLAMWDMRTDLDSQPD